MANPEETAQQVEDIITGELQRCRCPLVGCAGLVIAGRNFRGLCLICWGRGWYYQSSLQGQLHTLIVTNAIRQCECVYAGSSECITCDGCRYVLETNGGSLPLTEVTKIAVREGEWPNRDRLSNMSLSYKHRIRKSLTRTGEPR